ncbi:MAG: zinc ribbon domain-containing protein [Elusimicrobiota bacterium]
MNCPSCGNANAADASFCQVCYEILGKKAAFTLPAPVSPPVAVAAPPFWTPPSIAAAVLLFAVMVPARQWLMRAFWLPDFVNLAFHEGGHIIFGLLGARFIMVAGGTLTQLLLPGAAMLHFLKRGERLSACVALFWLGQNFLGIGRYVADARAQQLDLVAGGVHDWTYLLETTGLLIHDVGLGAVVQIFGCLVMAVAASAGIRSYFVTSARPR